MASLPEAPSGSWHIHFRFGGKRFKRSLQTQRESEARSLCGRVEDNILLVNRGVKAIPSVADVFRFLLSDGKVERSIELPQRLRLGELFDEYEKAVANRLEETTPYTVGVHTRHTAWQGHLGPRDTLDPGRPFRHGPRPY